MKGDLYICTNCGHVGRPENASLDFIEVFLWLVLLPLGIFWTIWRLMFNCNLCPACNKKATMIPTTTPLGQKLHSQIARNTNTSPDIITRGPRLQSCEGCGLNYDKKHLTKIESGQKLCPDCFRKFNESK